MSAPPAAPAAAGLFPPGVPVPTAGASVLLEMEDAKKRQDLPALKVALLKARKLPGVNMEWIDNALVEIENLEKVATDQGSTGILDVAKQCKEQGNAKLKEAGGTKAALIKQAGEHYTHGIALLSQFIAAKEKKEKEQAAAAGGEKSASSSDAPGASSTSDEAAPPASSTSSTSTTLSAEEQASSNTLLADCRTLLGQMYSNRAQVLLHMRDFVNCVDDCKRCLAQDPKNMKAFYRAARASLLNGLFQQSLDFCTRGLELTPGDADLQKLKDSAEGKLSSQKAIKEKINVSPQELLELQEKANTAYQQLTQLRQQINLKKQKRRAQEACKVYVSELDPVKNAPSPEGCYVGCGKAFLKREKEELVAEIDVIMAGVDAELPKMEKAEEELDARFTSAKKEFEDIVKYLPASRLGRK